MGTQCSVETRRCDSRLGMYLGVGWDGDRDTDVARAVHRQEDTGKGWEVAASPFLR